jgi:glycosyltransferase involved in cell wall biosynthesis
MHLAKQEINAPALLLRTSAAIQQLGPLIQHMNEVALDRVIQSIGLENMITLDAIIMASSIDIKVATFLLTLGAENTYKRTMYEDALALYAQQHSTTLDTRFLGQLVHLFESHQDPSDYLKQLNQRITSASTMQQHAQQEASACIQSKQWNKALHILEPLADALGIHAPKWILADLATCLHMLGRYEEAETQIQKGLGDWAQRISHPHAPLNQAEIQAQWNNTSDAPLISVVCISYNHARYIEMAIQGFLLQETQYKYEIIIHDDASTDGTQDLILKWQSRYPELIRTVLQKENTFSKGARPFELLLKQAKGKYIAICEGDDYWLEPSKLQKQAEFLEAHSDFSCHAHNHYLLEEATLSVRPWLSVGSTRVYSPSELKNLTRLLWIPTLMFRKLFEVMPVERDFAALGDAFLTSYLGHFGNCMYDEGFLGAVRRMNRYSFWTPMNEEQKEKSRVRTRFALVRLHERLGDFCAAADLLKKIHTSPLPIEEKKEESHKSLLFVARQVELPKV